MSTSDIGEGATDELVVVRVGDEINQTLTGHAGQCYESPPQPRHQALALVRLLLGYTAEHLDDCVEWTCPIAGGRRTVELKSATGLPGLTIGRLG
jgi:hypothetical protein